MQEPETLQPAKVNWHSVRDELSGPNDPVNKFDEVAAVGYIEDNKESAHMFVALLESTRDYRNAALGCRMEVAAVGWGKKDLEDLRVQC